MVLTKTDDLSLMLAKAYKAGFLTNIKPEEEEFLVQEARKLLSDDAILQEVFSSKAFFNVRDYGAKGDGVTNDRDAIKKAIDDANVAGGTVYFPCGFYFVGTWSLFANTGLSTFNRWAFWVGTNVSIIGDNATLTENIWYDNRRVMFYLEGSDILIRGMKFRNDYNMAGGSRPTAIPIGAGDGFNANSTTDCNRIRIENCIFDRPWHPTKFNFYQTGGTAKANDIKILNCISNGEPLSTSSGGYNFRSEPAGRIRNVIVANSECHDVTVSAAIGFYGVWDGAILGNICRGSQIDGGGIQLENGAFNVVIGTNIMIDHYNHIWIDDSSKVSIVNNDCRNATPGLNFKGLRFTKQGYTEDPNKNVTDIIASGNILTNCFVMAEPFGTPAGTPTFGHLTVDNCSVTLDGITNSYGMTFAGSVSLTLNKCTVTGGSIASISVSPQVNQYVNTTDCKTFKAGTETSVGYQHTNTNAFRPVVANNRFTQGMNLNQAVCMIVGSIYIWTGNGTPEGAVSSPIGSTYHRADGGANTSFYVKESGTGATGWVAK